MIGELATDAIDQILRDEVIGRIGCNARGRTYVVPVTYAYDGTSILGHTGEGLKVRMMRENPVVCFEVDQLRDLPSWRSVIIQGRFEELRGDVATHALRVLTDRLREIRTSQTAAPTHGAGVSVPRREETSPRQSVMYAIRIEAKTGRFEAL